MKNSTLLNILLIGASVLSGCAMLPGQYADFPQPIHTENEKVWIKMPGKGNVFVVYKKAKSQQSCENLSRYANGYLYEEARRRKISLVKHCLKGGTQVALVTPSAVPKGEYMLRVETSPLFPLADKPVLTAVFEDPALNAALAKKNKEKEDEAEGKTEEKVVQEKSVPVKVLDCYPLDGKTSLALLRAMPGLKVNDEVELIGRRGSGESIPLGNCTITAISDGEANCKLPTSIPFGLTAYKGQATVKQGGA